MKQKKCLLLLLMSAMSLTIFAWNGPTKTERFAGRMERAQLPSTMTSAAMTGRVDNATDYSTEQGSLRGGPPGNPAEPEPVGSGLALLTLCAGAYLFNSKKNKK